MMLKDRLRKARKARKLTQEELAKKLKTTKSTISNYENGHSSPPNEMLIDLSKILNVSTDYLLGLTDKENYPDEVISTVDKFLKEANEDDQEIREFMYLIMSEPAEERERLYRLFRAYLDKN